MFIRRTLSLVLAVLWLWPAGLYAQSGSLTEIYNEARDLDKAGHYEKAISLYLKALELGEQQLGPSHPTIGILLENLANLYKARGRPAEVEPLLKRALAIWEKALGPEHRDVAASMERYGALLREIGRSAEANAMAARATTIRAKRAETQLLQKQTLFETGMAAFERGDYAAALQVFEPLAGRGDAGGQYGLALMYHTGKGKQRDFGKAFELFYLAAQQGFALARAELGYMFVVGKGAPKDYGQAKFWFKLAAEQGTVRAQNGLGMIYLFGLGGVKDYDKAVAWYRRAFEQGSIEAANGLGIAYLNGLGVPQDLAQAMQLFIRAARAGDHGAQNNLGAMYFDVDGPLHDDVQAHMWFSIVIAQGFEDATHENAVKSRSELAKRMTPADVSEAEGLAQAWTPTRGLARAYKDLGVMYANGQGTLKDLVKAYSWLNVSAEAGEQVAATVRDTLAQVLSPEQITEAERLTPEWTSARRQ